MRESITQEFEYGCGIACFAFALQINYQDAVEILGRTQASSKHFWVKDIGTQLNRAGLSYQAKYVKPRLRRSIYSEGTIVLIRRSKTYPSGHYLIRHNGQWMDPWVNLPQSSNITKAKSGFRKRLPGSPMYAILPKM